MAQTSARMPKVGAPSWKPARPRAEGSGLRPWFDLTPRSPSIDSRIGADDVELSATLATYGGVTEPGPGSAGPEDGAERPPVILGGNPVAPGTPAGPIEHRTRQCTVHVRVAAEGLSAGRQCLLMLAVAALGEPQRPHWVQVLLGETMLGEDHINADDRIGVLFDLPEDGRFALDLWLRLAANEVSARLGLWGVQGHLL